MDTEDRIEMTLIGFLFGLAIGATVTLHVVNDEVNKIRNNADYKLEKAKHLYDEINRTERRIRYGLIKEK